MFFDKNAEFYIDDGFDPAQVADCSHGRGLMKSYRRLQKFIGITLVVYVTIGYSFHLLNWRELFPIFAWELFSVVPAQERIDFGLLITSVNGESLRGSVYFENAEDLFSEAHSIEAHRIIQLLARASINEDEVEVERVKAILESLFLFEADTVSYQVVRRTADILDIWQGKPYEDETVIRAFEMQG